MSVVENLRIVSNQRCFPLKSQWAVLTTYREPSKHPNTEMERNRVHSIELFEFYVGRLSERIVEGNTRIQAQDIRRLFFNIDTATVIRLLQYQ